MEHLPNPRRAQIRSVEPVFPTKSRLVAFPWVKPIFRTESVSAPFEPGVFGMGWKRGPSRTIQALGALLAVSSFVLAAGENDAPTATRAELGRLQGTVSLGQKLSSHR